MFRAAYLELLYVCCSLKFIEWEN